MIDLTVKTLDSQNHVFSLEDDQITVRGFKEYIAESVAVPADSQRLIYCGRVLQDEKKLNDYDVNGKVLHLVQRAPPQHGQRGNDSGQQAQGPNNRQQQRSHYRLTRAQMHGNAMYLGAMSVPAEFVEGHGIPQLSNSLSGSRLSHAGRMLDRINELIDRLDDPNAPLHPTPSEMSDYAQPPVQQHQQIITQEADVEQDENADVARAADGSARIAEAAAAAITAALSAAGARAVTLLRGGNYNGAEGRRGTTSDATDNQSDTQAHSQQRQQQQQQQQQAATEQSGATSSNAGQNRRAQQQDLPRPPQMAELLQRLYNTQDRLRPYLERYCVLTLVDPSLPPGPGPNTVEESQRIVDGVSEILHYMSHTCHALSDIIIDMSQPPPRNLRCRPIIVQHSAILQPGIPIQVEAHISLNGRGVNNNNSNDETAEAGNQQMPQSDNNSEPDNASRVHAEESGQEREPDGTTQPQTDRPQQEQGQSPLVFNFPNNVEVLMEVSSESNMDDGANNEQSTAGEGNNGGNARRTGVFPFGPAPPPYFMRNFMQAVAGHMVHGGFGATTISTSRTPPTTTLSQSTPAASMDSGNVNSGQSTQARSNVGTHPTTATQTRSTSRPHVFHHHTHPVGLGMSIGLGLDFDPYLPCNSHHVYRTPTSTPSTSANGGVTTSQTTRTTPTTATSTTDAPPSQAQTATTSTSTSASATSTTGTSTTNAGLSNSNLLGHLLQHMLDASRSQPNSNAQEGLESMVQMLGSHNIHVGYVNGRNSIGDFTLADLIESGGLNIHATSREDNLLFDLLILGAQNMTVDGILRLSLGEWEPISRLRRPLRDFLWHVFPSASRNALQEQVTENLLSQLRPYLREILASEEDAGGRSGSRIDVCATIEALITRYTRDILRILFDTTYDDGWFAQDALDIVKNLAKQLCAVLRYSIQGGQAGLEAIVTRILDDRLEGSPPAFRQWILDGFLEHFRAYSQRAPQPSDSEIVSLLVYKDSPSQQSSVQSSASARQPTQTSPEDEPMETEILEQRPTRETSVPEDREEVPETFAGHEALPSDWVPIIARDGVRQRRQLQMQGVTNSGVTTFSDAYLGGLPTKRRKLIEQQKPRLLVSPTPNHSTIAASMERLVREGVGRAGVEEVEGAAVAVAADPAVRRAFGQAIRDCLNPRRYGTADFPDPLRFPNATKYFSDQERPPK
ncbi:PREDICTED: large proline-rich protein bag6-B isoform X2 [Dinoponera quadriceps]|uniref:Large proline-rich protein BAG6 n=1 Tax=Dinoponera quadriceps TaxID=609295 RepID=A0A6P3XCL3_DINQU|nr:PREDICTED: large proline-rich protein bag6-B isoform X2 [Dinoponera quadriceps]